MIARGRTGWLAVLFALAIPLAAQTTAKDFIKKAKAAFDDENRALARSLYLQALNLDPRESSPYYRLGLLADDPEEAIGWFKAYVAREPSDAWGWLALGDRLLKAGRFIEARESYGKAARLAPRAEEIRAKLERGRRTAAVGLTPLMGYTHDSDENNIGSYGLEGEVPLPGGFKLGGRFRHTNVTGPDLTAAVESYDIHLDGRPRSAFTMGLTFGLARYAAIEALPEMSTPRAIRLAEESTPWTTPQGELRLRYRASAGGGAIDLRLRRSPMAASPILVFNHAIQDDARLIAELPLGPLRIRGTGRISLIEAAGEPANQRLEGDGALVLPLGWRGEISVQYRRLGYEHSPDVGYFAPRSVETIETGTYWELGGDGPWTADFDLGAGIQRLAKQGQDVGPWKPAFRGWGFFAYELAATLQARLEIEAYSAPFAPLGTVVSENWKYISVAAGLLFRIY